MCRDLGLGLKLDRLVARDWCLVQGLGCLMARGWCLDQVLTGFSVCWDRDRDRSSVCWGRDRITVLWGRDRITVRFMGILTARALYSVMKELFIVF